ncbi:MepB family protein [Pedobacter sp. KBW01]|uniref:MepB family protein n=1 Tax=Pedobacter sp. KBW01 TaxID=2153364 RepID=UPI0018F6851A|nr:MepB family protein [Pedobacter sp. KBW01]
MKNNKKSMCINYACKGNLTILPPALLAAIKRAYSPLGYQISNYRQEAESKVYCASTFGLNQLKVKYREAKITPTKTGQFVSIWKRDEKSITAPFNASDDFDLLIISVENEDLSGQFIFPKAILIQQKIITHNKVTGKRGIRLYPPWDMPTSKQAIKTQQWQNKYFLLISNQSPLAVSLTKKLLNP